MKAFIIEDRSDYYLFFEETLQEAGFITISSKDNEEAKSKIDKFIKDKDFPDICIVDELLEVGKKKYSGLDIIKNLLDVRQVPVLLISNYRFEKDVIEKAKKLNISPKFRISKEIFKNGFQEGKEEFLDYIKDAIRDFKFSSPDKRAFYTKEYERFGYKDGQDSNYYFYNFDSIICLEVGETSSQCILYFKNGEYKVFHTNPGTIGRQISIYYYPFAKVNSTFYVNLNEIISIKGIKEKDDKNRIKQSWKITIGPNKQVFEVEDSKSLRDNFFMLRTKIDDDSDI